MKKYKYLLILSILLVPCLVFASIGEEDITIGSAILMEAFVSIHMSVFVLFPLSNLLQKEDGKNLFWILFFIRIITLLIFDLFITTYIAMIDFVFVFVGAFIIVPIIAAIKKQNPFSTYNKNNNINLSDINPNNANISAEENNQIVLRCIKCNNIVLQSDNYCTSCGNPINASITPQANEPKIPVDTSKFDPIFNLDEDSMLEEFIKRELPQANLNTQDKLIPIAIVKRKNILNIIFSILLFIYISLIFFHFPILTYIIGLIILIIFYKLNKKFDLIKYLKKEIKSRPSEKILNIIMSQNSNLVPDNTRLLKTICILIALILPMFIFINPRIMYEKADNGYVMRFYTFGLTNFKTVEIPDSYKGEPVVGLRGNAFSNMPFLESVSLPNTIKEIRGQAFKNDIKLTTVNIPDNLEYLGGGSFYNCKSLTNISLPDTLTYMGGETFYKASSLETVKLSENLAEIRGDSFEYCTSLRSIKIPDKVTRIGGHAFYGDSSLSEVIITENSQLKEIGSSAFRQCYSLYNITIPSDTYVNERAFKESPTSISRFGDNVMSIDSVTGNNAVIGLGHETLFKDYDISAFLQSFNYDTMTDHYTGNFIINIDDINYYDINFPFKSKSNMIEDDNVAISYAAKGYYFKIVDLGVNDTNSASLTVSKNPNYEEKYNYKASYSFNYDGDSQKLPNSDYEIVLDKIEASDYKIRYIFYLKGEEGSKKIVGNGYTNSQELSDNVLIQIDSMYGSKGVYLNIYYN